MFLPNKDTNQCQKNITFAIYKFIQNKIGTETNNKKYEDQIPKLNGKIDQKSIFARNFLFTT